MAAFPRQAVVLAAGLGTRLKPLTLKTPKPALPVGGLPILFFNLFLLKRAGVRDVVVNLHHLPEKIRPLLARSKRLGLDIGYSLEPKILGTAGGIAQALRKMRPEPTYVLNGDILCDVDLRKFADAHRKSRARATLVCLPKDRAEVKSFVESDAKDRIWRIAGEPQKKFRRKKLKKWIFSGIHLIDPALLKGYPRSQFGCIIRQVYQPALERGDKLLAWIHRKDWWDLGSPRELTRVDRLLWSGKADPAILNLWREAKKWAG